MLKHLGNEAMWTPFQELPRLWEDVLNLHESPMVQQQHAQATMGLTGRGIWSSPGVTTFSPHHEHFTQTWASFYKCCLHVLCYQPKEMEKKHFQSALHAFNETAWSQRPGQHIPD